MSFASRLLKKVGGQKDDDPNNAPQHAYYPPPPATPYRQHDPNTAPQHAYFPPAPATLYQQHDPNIARQHGYFPPPPATLYQQHDPNNAPQHAYFPPPPASPYQQLAAAQITPPPRTSVAQTVSSPPPLPSRQQSSPQQFTSMVTSASPSLQPYHPPTQQGWLATTPPAPYLQQPSPQPSPVSPSLQPIRTPKSLAEAESMGGPSRQRSAKREPPQTRKILSLDGGGVRGLSIITIVKSIMKNLNRERGFDLEPWEEFDMIGGTSTGGIIAIMLGRLRMTLDECQSAYMHLSETIFTPIHHPVDPRRLYKYLKASGKFENAPLEDSIKSTIWSKQLHEDALLKDKDPDACKIFVCATRGEDGSLAVLRSYESKRHDPLYEICKIWEAARATSAASTFFEPIQIGRSRQLFVDGALTGSNNPVRTANVESRDVWPSADRLILSVGTGAAPGQAVTGNLPELATRLKDMVTDSEKTNRTFRMENNEMVRNGRLYRFNVMLGLANIGLAEHEAMNSIDTYTDSYLDDPDVFDMVQSCVNNLCRGGQRMGYAPTEGLTTQGNR